MPRFEQEQEQEQESPSAEAEGAPRTADGAMVERRASYLGFVAHEIRNPLSTALWTAELLGRMDGAERAGARGEKLAGMCLRSLQRVRHLFEDHILAERLDTGVHPVRLEALVLVDAVVAAEGRRGSGLQPVELAVPPELAVLADRTLLGRTLDALIDAASQGVSSVKVGAHGSGGDVTLVVQGAAADSRSLEDPLKGATSDTRGRALALPAARRAAAHMGGRLRVRDGAWELTLSEPSHDRHDER
jgi:K+-sensing histidine kinase KdpD